MNEVGRSGDERPGGDTARPVRIDAHGPGPFITRLIGELPDGRHRVATSRRHRKGLAPIVMAAEHSRLPHRSQPAAFGHAWAPRTIAWWVAVLFMLGSTLFGVASYASLAPQPAPLDPGDPAPLGWVFFTGSLFFTGAAALQLLEAMNGDVSDALGDAGVPRRWIWLAWKPRNLGFMASLTQLIGTVFFNLDTADALFAAGWLAEDLFVWVPDMLGSVCFLVASIFALLEVSHGRAEAAVQDISWWIAVVNLFGSVAFQISAGYSLTVPGALDPDFAWRASLLTLVGAACFFVGAYLMVPELFDGERRGAGPRAAGRSTALRSFGG